ncbi:hypothetical protein Ari01nite_78990 [Paractinoplanes rishiriensis]|uniref:Uncharacterized protein n=1 Tax=Paractinoplanes rishiriensis TaxID=1050105 RepID=A0A919MYW0_9ACTN|nr:hypothetical protein Ari01nite_78990 [Actinoplanes rishiriensis]
MRVLDHLAQEHVGIRVQILGQKLNKTFQLDLEAVLLAHHPAPLDDVKRVAVQFPAGNRRSERWANANLPDTYQESSTNGSGL